MYSLYLSASVSGLDAYMRQVRLIDFVECLVVELAFLLVEMGTDQQLIPEAVLNNQHCTFRREVIK